MEDWFGKLLGALALFFLLVPPRWDPMILWKEGLEGWPPPRTPEHISGWWWALYCAIIFVIVAGGCALAGWMTGP